MQVEAGGGLHIEVGLEGGGAAGGLGHAGLVCMSAARKIACLLYLIVVHNRVRLCKGPWIAASK